MDEQQEEIKLPYGLKQIKPGSIQMELSKKATEPVAVTRKKTQFDKLKEEKERKRREEEELTKQIYESFVEDFQGGDTQSKTFIRGETIVPLSARTVVDDKQQQRSSDTKSTTTDSKPKSSSSSSSAKFEMIFKKPTTAPAADKKQPKIVFDKLLPKSTSTSTAATKSTPITAPTAAAPIAASAAEKIAETLSTIGNISSSSSSSKKSSGGSGLLPFEPPSSLPSFTDVTDPETTNLYVGNLSPMTTEEVLLREFGRFGPIASVKIMWPRTVEERARGRFCGFVCFMERNDADEARKALNGAELLGHEIRVGWGKAVSRPNAPIYVYKKNEQQKLEPEVPVIPPELSGKSIQIVIPENKSQLKVINTTAMFVAKEGFVFERVIREREQSNPKFRFLFESTTSISDQQQQEQHRYYRWKVWSLLQGDSMEIWRTAPFEMVQLGQVWIPPPCAALSKTEEQSLVVRKPAAAPTAASKSSGTRAAESEVQGGQQQLSERSAEAFEDMLRELTTERSKIKEAMGFALDHADSADEICEILTDSLTLIETPIHKKIARLFLVSDILYNSSAPVHNASRFRSKFETLLIEIFEGLRDAYLSTGRLTAEQMKKQVESVLRVWSVWCLYPPAFLDQLQTIFTSKPENQPLTDIPTSQGVFSSHNTAGRDSDDDDKMLNKLVPPPIKGLKP